MNMKKQKYLIAALLVFGFCFVFYWNKYRPSSIKKECHAQAEEQAIENNGQSNGKFKLETYNGYFDLCLNEKGL